jgi:hypothetical protein
VLSDTWVDDTEPVTYRVVDPVTGEEAGAIEDVSVAELQGHTALGRHSLAISDDGATMVVAFGSQHMYLVTLVYGDPVVLPFAAPPGIPASTNGVVDVFLSPDGSMLSLTREGDESRTRWLLHVDGESKAWIEVPSAVPGEGPGYIFFVTGAGAKG